MQTVSKTITVFFIGVFVGSMVVWLWLSGDTTRISEENSGINAADITETDVAARNNTIVVSDQAPGIFVIVEKVSLSETTWIAVHEDNNGVPGTILGARLFDAGEYKGVTMELLRGTEAGGVYYAMLHYEDGDRAFNLRKDIPMRTVSDALIVSVFNVSILGE